MSKISQTAADRMQEWISKHGFADDKALLDYAYALSTHYGEAIGALSCQMYEATAAAQNVIIPAAEAVATPEYGEVARAVHGAKKRSEKMVPDTVGRLVKQVGADTTLRNAERDGAQFAWVPMGDTCAFCLTLASRGWQYMSKKALRNGHAEHIHANCDCQYAVRFDNKSTVEGYDPDKYLEMYENAEGRTPQEKINAMRRALAREKRELTGGKWYIPYDADDKRDVAAAAAYRKISRQNDIQIIAKNTGFSVEEIQQIKRHVFFEKHKKYEGYALLYPDYDMAVAWNRMSQGMPEERDILLLRHELLESQLEKEYNLTIAEAHARATKQYDWASKLIEDLGEDGEPDGLL